MKYTGFLFLVSLLISCATTNSLNGQKIPGKPNVIIIMADDLGYGDLESFGGDGSIRSPNIDRLAAEGLKMTDFHTNGVVCSPTRASLMTGLYPQEAGIASVVTAAHHRNTGMSPDKYTMAEFFKAAGYTTGIYGKWHLGYLPEFGPIVQGFDSFRGFVSGNIDYFSHIDQSGYPDWWKQQALQPERGYLTDLITGYGIDFIEKAGKRPFFLYLAHGAPHYPYQGPNDTAYRSEHGDFPVTGKFDDKAETYKEMIESLDKNIGRLMSYLQDEGLLEQTLILFLSDNGATLRAGSNRPFRGGKSTVYEGGHRVPALFYWKGVISPGTTNNTVLTMDILPTIAAIIDVELSAKTPVSGINVSPLMFDAAKRASREQSPRTVFWRWLANQRAGKQKAVRQGRWKLVINKEGTALYDLDKDIGETTDIKQDYPEKLKELTASLRLWEASLSDEEITVRDIN